MNNYIDIHSHILPGIDDGSKDIETSIEILKKLDNIGFKSIILTPHYNTYYNANNKIKKDLLKKLKARLKKENININLYLANEIKITSNLLELLKKDEISLINNYIFLELPFQSGVHYMNKIIYELQQNNIEVILVHPERYSYLKKKDYQDLLDHDVSFQINYESIIGKYGTDAKKRVKYLLKNNMVSYLATDVHKPNTILFNKFSKIENKIIKIVGEDKYKNITYNNMLNIIKK